MLRQPLVAVVGHVDHGKTLLLDNIRRSAVASKEAGGITQSIGASIVPLETIKKICGSLLNALKSEVSIPGLLFIDTPGHAAFTNLRKRGGSLADIAIVVVSVMEGLKPQTHEAIDILKHYKTPFVIALNKIDLIDGWQSSGKPLLQSIQDQQDTTREMLEKKTYEVVGQVFEKGFNAERFDRVDDYTKQIAMVPVSAKTGEGIPELLMVLTGLAQKYLEQCLKCNADGAAKGTILEVKEDKGIGTSLDVIIYDGTLKVNDIIVIGSLDKPIVTKVRSLFEPSALSEMRDKKTKFNSVKQVFAACGVKVSAPELDSAIAGMPLRGVSSGDDIEKIKQEIQAEVEEVVIETDKSGVIIKADTLGSLEALSTLLKESGISVRKASIGSISKKDISEAESGHEEDPLKSVVLGFNVALSQDVVPPPTVKVITNDVIYRLIEEFEQWKEDEKKRQEAKELDKLTRPCKLMLLQGYVFRQSNPAIVGVEILEGKIKTGVQLMKSEGRPVAMLKGIQEEKENLTSVEKGKQVAFSLDGVTVGRQINEGDTLYTYIPEEHFVKLKSLKKYLSKEEIAVLKEVADIMRETNPTWGI